MRVVAAPAPFKAALGPELAAKMIVAEATYESTDPNTDSQVLELHASGADTLFVQGVSKWASQTIRKVHDIGWRPLFILTATATSVSGVLEPAGLEKAKGIVAKARQAIEKRDAAAVKEQLEGLMRTHRMFKGVVAKT